MKILATFSAFCCASMASMPLSADFAANNYVDFSQIYGTSYLVVGSHHVNYSGPYPYLVGNFYLKDFESGDIVDSDLGNTIDSTTQFYTFITSDVPVSCNHEYQAYSEFTIYPGGASMPPVPAAVDSVPCPCPIVVDMGRNGMTLGAPGEYVSFDLTANGLEEEVQWVAAGGDEGFLALDLNGNGAIDDGGELFGNATMLGSGEIAENGFVALAQYDALELGGNGDGVITQSDEIWTRLLLWLDSDANGVSELNEISDISDSRLVRLRLKYRQSKKLDEAGNWLWLWSKAKANHSGSFDVVDVAFKVRED